MEQKVDTEKLITLLQEKWGNRGCPMCGQTKWNVSEKAFEIREFQGGDLILGDGAIFPLVPILCNNCGNTLFINPIVTKIIPTKDLEKK